jgi:hypothetical protein
MFRAFYKSGRLLKDLGIRHVPPALYQPSLMTKAMDRTQYYE